LRKVHLVLQEVFGWTNSHLHKFEIGRLSYAERSAGAQSTATFHSPSTMTCLEPHCGILVFSHGQEELKTSCCASCEEAGRSTASAVGDKPWQRQMDHSEGLAVQEAAGSRLGGQGGA
jgi:hypothetical protein